MNKKKILALLLSGVMAVGGLSLTVPVAAQAADSVTDQDWQKWAGKLDCEGFSDAHIKSHNVDVVNGLLTVTMEVQSGSTDPDYWSGGIFIREQEMDPMSDVGDGKTYYDFDDFGSTPNTYLPKSSMNGGKGSFNLTFEGLTVGKTYYVYGYVYDTHDTAEAIYGTHYAIYLGSGVPTATSASGSSSSSSSSSGSASSGSSNASASVSYEDTVATQIETAESGSTVVMENGISALSNSTMKELLAKGDVSLRMEFTYQDKEYVIIIPAGAALDNDIPWYGPLYLAQHFGNSAGTAGSGAGGTYEVKSGDTLSRIAAASNMTLQQLLAKNPQIKDPNKIIVGQKINR